MFKKLKKRKTALSFLINLLRAFKNPSTVNAAAQANLPGIILTCHYKGATHRWPRFPLHLGLELLKCSASA